jgi:signal transduction histidine kinase
MAEPDPNEVDRLAGDLRGGLASLRVAAETLGFYPQMPAAQRDRLLGVVDAESRRIELLVERLAAAARPHHKAGMRAPIAARSLIEAIAHDAAARGLSVTPQIEGEAELEVDAATLVASCAQVLALLQRDFAISAVELRFRTIASHAQLDLRWRPEATDLPALPAWQSEALDHAVQAPSLRSAVRDQGGEVWFNLEREGLAAHLRLLLVLARR